MSDLRGYITKRVISRDEAEVNGTYWTWPELEVEFAPSDLGRLRYWAAREGVDVDDLIVAVVTERAVQVFREAIAELGV